MRALLDMNLLLALSLGIAALAARLLAPRASLRLAHALIAASLALPLLTALLPRDALLPPAVQVWDGPSRAGTPTTRLAAPARLAESPSRPTALPETEGLLFAWAAIAAMLLALHATRATRLARRLAHLPTLRRIGGATIQVHSSDESPYSFMTPTRAYVSVPAALLARPAELRISIQHELQHHRAGDTRAAHAMALLAHAFFWNPFVHAWARWLARTQELACDAALVGRRNVAPQAYGLCLLRAAESAARLRARVPVASAGMATRASGSFLRRRIALMLTIQNRKSRRWPLPAALVLGLTFLATASYASRSLVQDRALSLDEARALVAGNKSGIPLEVNELVLRRLNRIVGTPEGRRRMREGIARMPIYRPMIERRLRERGYPTELLAIPLIESGYNNASISPAPHRAAGIWQFIPETARNYGMRVDAAVDERLDPARETRAAMDYYADLLVEFDGDWLLALKSYNEGEQRVRRLINAHGTEDAWELERVSTTEGYLAKAVAAMIVLKNPRLLD
jgi:beta-lactamase regulating signal transducer with metallopeptidase domain